jgi:hypothetical protein
LGYLVKLLLKSCELRRQLHSLARQLLEFFPQRRRFRTQLRLNPRCILLLLPIHDAPVWHEQRRDGSGWLSWCGQRRFVKQSLATDTRPTNRQLFAIHQTC